jgi:hypothetical protein
MEAATHRQPW